MKYFCAICHFDGGNGGVGGGVHMIIQHLDASGRLVLC